MVQVLSTRSVAFTFILCSQESVLLPGHMSHTISLNILTFHFVWSYGYKPRTNGNVKNYRIFFLLFRALGVRKVQVSRNELQLIQRRFVAASAHSYLLSCPHRMILAMPQGQPLSSHSSATIVCILIIFVGRNLIRLSPSPNDLLKHIAFKNVCYAKNCAICTPPANACLHLVRPTFFNVGKIPDKWV